MIRPGLVSVTFRQLAPPEVARWAAKAKLEGIEWGGDIHVPHGQLDTAHSVAAVTRDAGLEVAAYGSYYRLGHEPETFPAVLETTLALGAPLIRVWAGRVGSAHADDAVREEIATDGRRIAELAAAAGVRLACEWHGGTLTDTAASAVALFEAVGHPAFETYWQPPNRMPFEQCLQDLDAALPRLAGLHVFQWHPETVAKQPLRAGAAVWKAYLAKASEKAAQTGPMFALLEFVIDNDPRQMLHDAATLRDWLR